VQSNDDVDGHPSHYKILIRWVVRAAVALCALSVVLSLVGAAYEMLGRQQDARRFRQHGKSVKVGNLALNLDCRGAATPTVILESGAGVPAVGWMKAQAAVSGFARVCSYDRVRVERAGARTAHELGDRPLLVLTAGKDDDEPDPLTLQSAGFSVVRVRGSYHFLRHPDGRTNVVPGHAGETIGPGLLRKKILRDCDLAPEQLEAQL
jgi:predicted RNA binding protein YcfA (HicA-like mRNA interferase family)